jgi:hypothetical protein
MLDRLGRFGLGCYFKGKPFVFRRPSFSLFKAEFIECLLPISPISTTLQTIQKTFRPQIFEFNPCLVPISLNASPFSDNIFSVTGVRHRSR